MPKFQKKDYVDVSQIHERIRNSFCWAAVLSQALKTNDLSEKGRSYKIIHLFYNNVPKNTGFYKFYSTNHYARVNKKNAQL